MVKQENSYYAFGMVMANSPVPQPTVPNKQLYNGGSEWQNDYSNQPDYYQTYDAALGRFIGVDLMAEATESMTSYQYADNNPIMFNDPLGNVILRGGNPDNYDGPPVFINHNSNGSAGWFSNFDIGGDDGVFLGYLTDNGQGGANGGGGSGAGGQQAVKFSNEALGGSSNASNNSGFWSGINRIASGLFSGSANVNASLSGFASTANGYSYWTDDNYSDVNTVHIVETKHYITDNQGRILNINTDMASGLPSLEDMKNSPPKDPGYVPPKSGARKGNSSRGKGWVDRNGNVWVPDDHNGTHAPHWDVQPPKGPGYTTVYPDPANYPSDEAPNNNYVAPGNGIKISPIVVGTGIGVGGIIATYWWLGLLAL